MAIHLSGGPFDVVVEPARGADVLQITDRETETPLLAVSPTARSDRRALSAASSQAQWLAGYPGGWQLLVPNAGPERTHDGVQMGFHGEASLAEWDVLEVAPASCILETWLATSPLHLHRRVSTDDAGLAVVDTISNLSAEVVYARVVQHPAFGAPFLDEDSFVVVPAATLVTDAQAPGNLARADVVGTPRRVLGERAASGRIRLPGPASGDSLFAAFTDFSQPRATFHSPNRGFAVRLDWDRVYPHAWFWIESNASSGWPWFRRMHTVAIEPATVLPGDGLTAGGRHRGGRGVAIEPGVPLVTTTSLARLPLGDGT
ncbi:UNVERIFIED_CONTAM: aldose 1-epimerase family protein [Microbacterium sp. SLM126]